MSREKDTAGMRLRELAKAATPGQWKYHVENHEVTRDGDEPDPLVATRLIGEGILPAEGRLIALAPEMAVLLVDAMDALELLSNADGVIGAGDMTATRIPPHEIAAPLLARYAELDERA